MNKLDGTSLDLEKLNIDKIKELFPNVVTEGKIDFDKLKIILGDQIDDTVEKYQFTWNGKSSTIKLAQSPSTGTLIPSKDDSKNWDTTGNLYIEGDNLEVLKQLQKTYYGKIKMIYIDPPYNTGGDFVYKDDFKDNIQNYKEQTKQTSRANPETNGRFHTDWLNMMYSRLMLARNLLSDDGAILIHIDEHEVSKLQIICCEIFGSDNELGLVVWDKRNPKGTTIGVAYQHESILAFCKNRTSFANTIFTKKKENAESMLNFVKALKSQNGSINEAVKTKYKEWLKTNKNDFSGGELAYNLIDNNGDIYRIVSMAAPDKPETRSHRPLIHPLTKKPCPTPAKGWRFTDETMDDLLLNGKIEFGVDHTTQPNQRYYLKENMEESVSSLIYYGGSDDALGLPFDNPKPLYISKRLVYTVSKDKESLVLDFFSGSATTAHAVMQLNAEDGGNRKFIMVQLPELTDVTSEAYKAGYKNICEIGKERIRRAGDQIKQELIDKKNKAGLLDDNIVDPETFDNGFKVFKLESTNIIPWDGTIKFDEDTIFSQTEVIKEDRTSLDVLYEIMLKYGVFDKPVELIKVNGKTMYSIAKGYLIVCLDNNISLEDVKEIGKLKPCNVIFKESGFRNDNDKINATYTLEKLGVEEVKSI
ncbi:MAG: site-specific DNA-methyltransferase [Tenericutes bacterium HGW-Tenericutes-2]|jgi:adenine-specific DNA-methyltransferase|nr:MAG: site-specific DNA-methyltransferase [Tenericutes bacterium HGW-Tenericutes-2]